MKSALSYLLAARLCEIGELERLANTSELVGVIGRFTHALQRERGASNIFLASRGQRFAPTRLEQIPRCDALQAEVMASFEALAADPATPRNGARLFNRIAVVLDTLEGLPRLRERVGALGIPPREATEGYIRIIAGLLAVVFEAADSAGDPEISRALVAMFHFMQGKEYAGQERAHGAAVFASGRVDTAGQQHWRHLMEQQQHCQDVFREFADARLIGAEHASQNHETLVQIQRLRHIGQALDGDSSVGESRSLVDHWYDACTARLDAMRGVEDLIAAHLRALCERKIGQARDALRDQEATLAQLHQQASHNPGMAPLIGPQLERSVIDLVQEQARRLQAVSDELESVRTTLNERKLIERAKGLLMAHQHIGEDEAYRRLRQMAMNQKRRIAEVAQAVLAMADVLGGPRR